MLRKILFEISKGTVRTPGKVLPEREDGKPIELEDVEVEFHSDKEWEELMKDAEDALDKKMKGEKYHIWYWWWKK